MVLFGCGVACNILYPFTESYLPVVIYKLINVTFVPYLYVYLIGIFVYIHRAKALKILKKLFWFLLGIYIVWSAINGTLFNFSLGHYTNIITGILVCLLTLSGGYYFGKHRLKHDYSYSIYLYHMIVINVLVVLGLTEQNISIAYTYVVTILLSIVSVRWIEPNGARALKKLLNSRVFTKNSNR